MFPVALDHLLEQLEVVALQSKRYRQPMPQLEFELSPLAL
jgi:hypothetical protein